MTTNNIPKHGDDYGELISYSQTLNGDITAGSTGQENQDAYGGQQAQNSNGGFTSYSYPEGTRGGAPFTKDEYEHIIKLLNNTNISTTGASANVAGIPKYVALLVLNCPECIVDSGAANHMASSLNLFDQASIVESISPKRVHLPNGDVTLISHIGSSSISSRSSI